MTQKITAIELARWIIKNFPDKKKYPDLTQLKLQKLAFYCFSIALAKGYGDKFDEDVNFEPWRYGPVCKIIYDTYRHFGSKPIDPNIDNVHFNEKIENLFKEVIYIYGSLSPSKIVKQTHLEEPYDEARKKSLNIIKKNKLEKYFKSKFFETENIKGPECVFDMSSFYLDGIPVIGFKSFDELAAFSRKLFFS